jgi:hypothetical protein
MKDTALNSRRLFCPDAGTAIVCAACMKLQACRPLSHTILNIISEGPAVEVK